MLSFITDSAEQTVDVGVIIAKLLKPNTAIALCGQLGCGKTTLVKGIAAGLGIKSSLVVSPSFVLMREYKGGRLPLFHSDLYRLKDSKQVFELGVEDYFRQNGILVIEWADKAEEFLPAEYLCICIFFLAKNKRRFKLKARGERYQSLIERLTKKLNK